MATIKQIAGWLECQVPTDSGDGNEMVRVSGLDGAGADSVVFATDTDTLVEALGSKAGVVLASVRAKAVGVEPDARVLWVDDARYAFAVVAKRLADGGGVEKSVHSSTVIGAGA